MLKVILASVAALPVVATATVAATGLAWVDVREGGAHGSRIVVPVPLLLAQTAAGFVPLPDVKAEMGADAARALPVARKAIAALREAPDCELVRVEERDQTVVITKESDALHVQVNGPKEHVDVNVPLAMAADVITADGRVDPMAAVRGLQHARFRTLVDVRDGDDRVTISVW